MPTTYQPKYNTYIGARYVPLIDGAWNNTKQYEPLTIVTYQGNSYTSKTYVPVGVDINNETYWVLSGNYNAQVAALQEQVTQNTEDIATINDKLDTLQTSPYISVKSYGAIGDGVTDDTNAILAAINAANNGDIIYFPNATYKISTVSISKNVTIDLCGSTIISDGVAFSADAPSPASLSLAAQYTAYSIPKFTLSSPPSTSLGDLVIFTSSDLYDTSRTYYYKGGCATVIASTGSSLITSMPFPFNLENGCAVKIYHPVQVAIKNGKIKCSNPSAKIANGVIILHGANCTISNLDVSGYAANIQYSYCINSTISKCSTSSPAPVASTNEDYGIVIASCTNINVESCSCTTGSHGFTSGGWETNFNLTVSNSSFTSINKASGYDNHTNINNSTVSNCTFTGGFLYGKVILNNCVCAQNIELSPSNDAERCEYVFNNCNNNSSITLRGRVSSETAENYKYCKGISVNGGTLNSISLNCAATQLGSIQYVNINGTTITGLTVSDVCNSVNISNITRDIDEALIVLMGSGKISALEISNSAIASRYKLIDGANYGIVSISNVDFTGSYPSSNVIFTCTKLYITNSILSTFTNFNPTVKDSFSAINSSFRTTPKYGASTYLSNVIVNSSAINAITINNSKYQIGVLGENMTVSAL